VRQSRAIQRFGAVNRKLRSPVASAARDLPLREPVRSAIPSQNHPQSGECRIKANPGEGDDWSRSIVLFCAGLDLHYGRGHDRSKRNAVLIYTTRGRVIWLG
jgi:hypothetical protein